MWIGSNTAKSFGLGLSGAHRTGKTTIGKRLAEVFQCPFIESSASQVAKDMGITKFEGMSPDVRRAYQDTVLKVFTERYETESQNGIFVSDRTPVDFAAYVMADWCPGGDPEHDAWASDYLRRCREATSAHFFQVAVVQPGIEFAAAEGKPAANDTYQEVLNTLAIGLIYDPRVTSHAMLVPRNLLDNEQRVSAIGQVFMDRFDTFAEDLASLYTSQ